MSDLALERALLRDRWIVGGWLALLVALAVLWLWRDYIAMARWDESMSAMGMKDMEMEGGRWRRPPRRPPISSKPSSCG